MWLMKNCYRCITGVVHGALTHRWSAALGSLSSSPNGADRWDSAQYDPIRTTKPTAFEVTEIHVTPSVSGKGTPHSSAHQRPLCGPSRDAAALPHDGF